MTSVQDTMDNKRNSSSPSTSVDQVIPNDIAEAFAQPLHPTLTRFERTLVRLPEGYYNTVAGGLAGATSAIVSCPLDVIKTKLQAQGGLSVPRIGEAASARRAAYRGVKGTAFTVWREDGLKGFYRGLNPLLLGYVPTWAVYLTIYNRTRSYISNKPELSMSSNLANMCGAVVAGASSTTITNPIWVIKTRLMSQSNSKGVIRTPWQYAGTWDAVKKMYMHEGVRSFYSGLTPALLGVSHVAVQFPLYEIFKEKLTGIEVGRPETLEEKAVHFWGLALAVFLSKVIASTVTYPHEVVRTRLQTQQRSHLHHEPFADTSIRAGDHGRPPGTVADKVPAEFPKLRGTVEICQTIYRQEGWRGFYAGLGTNLIRAVPSAMTTILTYEYIKSNMFEAKEVAVKKLEDSRSRPSQA